MKRPQFTLRRLLATVALVGIGVPMMIDGARREMQNPRSNSQDLAAWRVLVVGAFLVGAGIAAPFSRPAVALWIGLATPPVLFIVLELSIVGYLLVFAALRCGFG